MTEVTPLRTKTLSLLLATLVVLSATAGLAGLAGAATTTDLTVSIDDDDNTITPGETTTVDIAVASAGGGVAAGEFGVELDDPDVATITDVTVLNEPGNTINTVSDDGQSANVKFAFANSPDTGPVSIVEVTLQADSAGSTDIDIVENSDTGFLAVFDANGAGYTLDEVGSATLTVQKQNQEPTADAGADQTVTAGDTVTLDASDSSDDDGSIASYSWSTDADVSLSDASAEQPTFTAPDVDSATTLQFELKVTDDDGATATDTVSVTVQPPEAANFQVSNLNAPDSVTEGDSIDVSVEVENTGGQTATKTVEFRVDTNGDGSIAGESAVAAQDVELDPDESTTVTFDNVDTSSLPVGTLTHGVTTPDSTVTAQITVQEQNQEPTADDVTVRLEPADKTTAVGTTTTYDVVVKGAQGVGAGEVAVTVDDTSIATITDLEVLHGAEVDAVVTDDSAQFDYFRADTADSGPVTIATVTVEGVGEGTASLSVESTSDNSEVLLFDEDGTGYDVTDTTGANVEVLPVQFSVESVSAPEKAAVGSPVTVTATISSDGEVESTQPVELLFDVDGDGTMESVTTEQVTIDPNGQIQVSFDVQVPEEASFGDRTYSVETIADSAGETIEFTPPALGPDTGLPGDLNEDGLYEDVNGDGSVNVGDAQTLFGNRESDIAKNNVAAFDFNGDGSLNVGDAQTLFDQCTD